MMRLCSPRLRFTSAIICAMARTGVFTPEDDWTHVKPMTRVFDPIALRMRSTIWSADAWAGSS